MGLDWTTRASQYSNHDLESQVTSPFSLSVLLHCGTRSIPFPLKHNLLIQDTVGAWREIGKKLGFSPFMSNHLHICGPLFPQAQQHPTRNLRFKTSPLDIFIKRNRHKISDLYKPLKSLFKIPANATTSSKEILCTALG